MISKFMCEILNVQKLQVLKNLCKKSGRQTIRFWPKYSKNTSAPPHLRVLRRDATEVQKKHVKRNVDDLDPRQKVVEVLPTLEGPLAADLVKLKQNKVRVAAGDGDAIGLVGLLDV